MSGTESEAYAQRLQELSQVWWKRLLRPVDPYAWNLRRLDLGRTLDVGCGIGRNLAHLPAGSVGVDHNAASVAHCRALGLTAHTVEGFLGAGYEPGTFDGLLVSHVLEHLERAEAIDLLSSYVRFLRPGGKAVLICPQERGYASDDTHVTWTTGEDLQGLARAAGLTPERWRSFPLPRAAGRLFIYNEFTVLARKET